MTVSLRDARHAPQQRAWLERSYANWLIEFARRRVTADEANQGLAEWFGDRRNIVILLMRDGLPAGFSVFARLPLPSLDAFRMQEFYVEPEMRRRGVGRAAAPLVFDRFYRATATRSMPGSGLGLAIVSQFAEDNDANTYVLDNAGGGTVVGLQFK